jgi:hypothetical protein
MKSSLHSLIPSPPFLVSLLRLPSQDTPTILIQPATDPRYIASGRPQQKTPFPNNSSVVIEECLSRCCLFSFPREPFYQVVARKWTFILAPLFRLSGVVSQYLSVKYFTVSGCKQNQALLHSLFYLSTHLEKNSSPATVGCYTVNQYAIKKARLSRA